MAAEDKTLSARPAESAGIGAGKVTAQPAAGPLASRAAEQKGDLPALRLTDTFGPTVRSTRDPQSLRDGRLRLREVLEGCMEPLWLASETGLSALHRTTVETLAQLHGETAARFWEAEQGAKAISTSYHASLRSEFNAACREFLSASRVAPASAGTNAAAALKDLELIGYGEMELAARIERVSARIRNATDETFTRLALRLAGLAGESELLASDNPLRPSIFCRTYCHVLKASGILEKDMPRLLRSCERALTKIATSAYAAVDRYLERAGLSPDITISRPVKSGRERDAGAEAGVPRDTAQHPNGDQQGRGPLFDMLLQALYERLNLTPAAAPAGPAPGVAATVPAGAQPGMAWTAGNGAAPLPASAKADVLGRDPTATALAGPTPTAAAALGQNPAGAGNAGPSLVPSGALPLTSAQLARGAWGGTPMTVPAGVPMISLEAVAQGLDLAALQRLAPAAGSAAAAAQAGAMPGQSTGGEALGLATVALDPGLTEALSRIQNVSALAVMAGTGARHGQAVARQANGFRDELLEKAKRQVDQLTIEIVGMLFDRIANDKHLPDAIKGLLRELQYPTIRIALLDPNLFTKPNQPARQLIDRIASTAVGWTSDGEENERYYGEVKKAVYTVLSDFEDGPGAFVRALEGFEKYLADERARDDDPVVRAKRALADAENREVMAINAMIKIRASFDGVQVESYLRDFLLNTWSRVIAAIWHKDKGDEHRMQRLLDAVPDIVWSVQPKINADERKRLIEAIPRVLASVREGLALIDVGESEKEDFFSKLVNSHAQAVKALEVAHGIGTAKVDRDEIRGRLAGLDLSARLPVDDDAIVVDVAGDVARRALAAADATTDVDIFGLASEPPGEAPPATAGGTAVLTDAEVDAEVRRWRRGDWLDLVHEDRTERVRLRWISPRRSFYLFQPADGGRAHSMPLKALRESVRRGRLKVVGQAPLFERLVNGLMAELRHTEAAADEITRRIAEESGPEAPVVPASPAHVSPLAATASAEPPARP